MKRAFAFATLMIVSMSSISFAGDLGVKLKMHLSPAGSFVAQGLTLQPGSIQKVGDSIVIKNLVFDLTSLKTGIELRDNHMKTKYLETPKYPKATLIQAKAKDGKFKGDLQVHGAVQSVEGTYTRESDGTIHATFPCSISKFKIGQVKYMGVGVQDQVDVDVSMAAPKGF